MTPSGPSAIVRTHPVRIFVRSTNWIGDAVMCMPAVQRLRELYPDAHIALGCAAKLQDLWRHNPFLNAVIPFTDALDPAVLRREAFDLAILFPNSFRSAWEAYRAGIRRRIGFAGHSRRWLLTDILPEPAGEQPVYENLLVAGKQFQRKRFPVVRHQAHRYLDLVGHLGGNRELCPPRIWFAHEDMSPLKKFLPDVSHPCIGLNAGAEFGPAKRWFPQHFADVARRVADQFDCHWVILGGPGDAETAARIQDHLRGVDCINLAGKTTLLELCELLRYCRLVLTNDTGPMHLTTAVGTPVVAIFGSTSAELTGPLGAHAHIVHEPVACSPCFLRECPIDFRCMHQITVDRVTAAVIDVWQHTALTHGHR